MADIGTTLKPATDMFSGSLSSLAKYAWVFIPLVIIGIIIGVVFIIKKTKKKKSQWTHTLKVRRVLADGRLTDPFIHKMRRFPLVKRAEIFELEKPLLGGYLLPEPAEYSGVNEYSIILDNNNRIYTNQGEFFNPDKSTVNVSARHSEIDIQRSNLNAKFKDINKVSKRIEWATIAKYALAMIAIVAVMIVGIVAIQNWGEAQQYKADAAQAEAAAMNDLAKAMESVKAAANTYTLLIPKLQDLYGTKNIQSLINNSN